MSTGTLETSRAGHTTISAGTMERLAAAIAADAFKVPLASVRAGIRDLQGQLYVSLSLGLAMAPLADIARTGWTAGGDTVFHHAGAARDTVSRRLMELAGTRVIRVDIRFTGAQMEHRERVT